MEMAAEMVCKSVHEAYLKEVSLGGGGENDNIASRREK
jgi:hypothetical protein